MPSVAPGGGAPQLVIGMSTPVSRERLSNGSHDRYRSCGSLHGRAQLAAPSPDVRRYLGLATYQDGDEVVAATLLPVDVGAGGPTTPPTTTPPTTEPPTTEPPTTEPTTTPAPTTSLPGTGGGDAGLYAGLGAGALVLGGLLVAMAARRLRSGGDEEVPG